MAKYFTKNGDEYEEVEAFSQDELESVIDKRLERERKKFADYDDLKNQTAAFETEKSELESKLNAATEKQSELAKQLGKAQLETDRVKIVHEFKLPKDYADFVTGENADEMRERAEKLASGIGGGKFNISKNEKPDGGDKSQSAKIAGKLFGTKSDD